MQLETEETAKSLSIGAMPENEQVSFYRTQWLMAHNHLHAVVHNPSASPTKEWDAYIGELQSAELVAHRIA